MPTLSMLSRYGAAILPLLAICEVALHYWFAERAPKLDDYAAVVEPVASLREPGDLVVMAPRWAEPMARRAVGQALMPLADVARPDEAGYRHAVEVSVLGQRDGSLAGWRELSRTQVGKFTIRRLENPQPEQVAFDFVEQLSPQQASVHLEPGAQCSFRPRARVVAGGLGGHPTWPAERFVCRAAPHLNVGVTVIADERWLPRRCIWAHPPRHGELVIRFRSVPLAEQLVGHGGMYWMTERARSGAPVELRVAVDGDEVGRYIHADGDGWSSFEMPLGRHAGAEAAEVTFAVSSPDATRRDFCFEARSR